MADEPNAEQSPQDTPDDTQGDTGTEDAGGTDTGGADSGSNPNREAAKYRTQLRDTEAERDRLAARVDAYERAELDRLAAGKLADPSDWQPDRDQIRDDDGNIDEGKAAAALDRLLTEKPHYAAKPPAPPRSSGQHAGGQAPSNQRLGSIFSG